MQSPAELVVPPPDAPMSEREDQQRTAKKFKATKRAFADTVATLASLNGEEVPFSDEHDWAFKDPKLESDCEMDEQDKADIRLSVKIPKDRKELCREWKLALIIKYLGKNISFSVLNQTIPNL